MKKLLLVADVPKEAIDRLSQVFDVSRVPTKAPIEQMLKGALGSYAVICDPLVKLAEPVIEVLAPTCKIISICGKEYKNIDLKAAKEKDILVCRSESIVSDAKADMVFGLIFAAGRRIIEGNEYVRFGRYRGECPNSLIGEDVSLQTLGILGAGVLSRAVCARARAFNMKVLYASSEDDAVLNKLGAKQVSFDDLLAFSDYLTVHDEYKLNDQDFDIMKDNCVLINVADAELIDEDALLEALEQNKIRAAALDVYSKEAVKKLTKLDNCILTPNMSSATIKKRSNMINDAIKNVLDYLDGETIQGIVK